MVRQCLVRSATETLLFLHPWHWELNLRPPRDLLQLCPLRNWDNPSNRLVYVFEHTNKFISLQTAIREVYNLRFTNVSYTLDREHLKKKQSLRVTSECLPTYYIRQYNDILDLLDSVLACALDGGVRDLAVPDEGLKVLLDTEPHCLHLSVRKLQMVPSLQVPWQNNIVTRESMYTGPTRTGNEL